MNFEWLILTAVSFPFLWAGLMSLVPQKQTTSGWVALVSPLVSFSCLLSVALSGSFGTHEWAWVPSLNLNFSLLVDGFSLFWGLIVSGIAVLVFLYARFYMADRSEDLRYFYGWLQAFMGAMLGTLFSDNFIQLFIFWELTGLCSFILIGYEHHQEKARLGARMAFLITAITGLCLLAGLALVASNIGSTQLSDWLAQSPDASMLGLALMLVLLGAFGKSAQFPFHFWLPNAMTAPTPVSAFLHSATMVKLGVFLVGRLYPVFESSTLWTPLVLGIGLVTLILSAYLALTSYDLKGILAWSTVSQLGMLICYYAWYHPKGVTYDYLHILHHVFYKGCLFMIAGIIDHSCGTRDIRKLGGLMSRLPWLGVSCLVACASMAGLPLTLGFISKELVFKEMLHLSHIGSWSGVVIAVILLGAVFKVMFSARIFSSIFLGKPYHDEHFHHPGWGMQVAPFILTVPLVVFGLFPNLFGEALNGLHIHVLHGLEGMHLKLWHGWNLPLALSAGVVLLGFLAFKVSSVLPYPNWLKFDSAFNKLMDTLPYLGNRMLNLTQVNRFEWHMPLVFGLLAMLAISFGFASWGSGFFDYSLDLASVIICTGFAIAVLAVPWMGSWLGRLIMLGAAGFFTTVIFVYWRAPDLALTQILIETVTLLLIALLLGRFPQEKPSTLWNVKNTVVTGIALIVGLGCFVILTHVDLHSSTRVATDRSILEASLPLAQAQNVVNAILVDFRGYDTLGEIAVLVIACLGMLGLLMRRITGNHQPPQPPDRRDLTMSWVLSMIAKPCFFVLNIFAVYMLVRGHNHPGGGFIAGLITATSLILLQVALGVEALRKIFAGDPARLAIAGLALSIFTGIMPMLAGYPFLEHFNWKLKGVFLLGDLAIGTPLLFDLGVYLVVVGVTCKMIFALSQSTMGYPALLEKDEQRYTSPDEKPIELEGETYAG